MASDTIAKVVSTLKAEREHFEEFCRSLTNEELERMVPPDNKWSVKDFAAHLGTLDTELVRWFEAVASGVQDEALRSSDGSPFNIDHWNDSVVAKRHAWTLDQIFDEAAKNRTRVITSLEKLTEEQINQVMHFAGDNKRPSADVPLKLFLLGLAHHDAIHVADQLKALPDRDTPKVREWLNHPAVSWYQTAMAGPAVR